MAADDVLALETRRRVYETVRAHAGIHFRELERRAGLPAGTARYHLAYLSRNGLIKEEKDGNLTRYFPAGFGEEKLMALLRQKSVRDILLVLISDGELAHEQIVSAVRLSPSTVSWHLRKLEEGGAVRARKDGKKVRYSLSADRKTIMSLLITYRESFLDSLVDRVIEMWE
ncbi:MAG: winged helix-turn-helix transcriptional regulator [Candidatus Micrarchaeota archaeon]